MCRYSLVIGEVKRIRHHAVLDGNDGDYYLLQPVSTDACIISYFNAHSTLYIGSSNCKICFQVLFFLTILETCSTQELVPFIHCYQCNSTTLEEFPLCDAIYWNSLSAQKKLEMLTACPTGTEFCVKRVSISIEDEGFRKTERGCYSCNDAASNCTQVKEAGCGELDSYDQFEFAKICFCDTDECNQAATNEPMTILAIGTILTFIIRFINCACSGLLQSSDTNIGIVMNIKRRVVTSDDTTQPRQHHGSNANRKNDQY